MKEIFLFDVDNTLTKPRDIMPDEVKSLIKKLKNRYNIAFVGGSDLVKLKEQLGNDCLKLFNYGFPENGVMYYKGQELIESKSFIEKVGEKTYQNLINDIHRIFAEIKLPFKRSTFFELRKSLLNISPVGRNCTFIERKKYSDFDKEKKIREKIVAELEPKYKSLKFSIGGQISIDIFPIGWDKTYCLRYLEGYDIIHFFGDKTEKGGNDYEIYNHSRIKGYKVNNYKDTVRILSDILK